MQADIQWFKDARYGLFIHYGLYSMLGRGEWVLNRERIPIPEYKKLADQFTADRLDFDALLDRAKNIWGMRYAVLTTKHHDGFCLYDSALTDFNVVKTRCRRDLVAEFVEACRRHDVRIGLYHSLNDWTTSPDAADALDRPDECYGPFIDFVHGQIRDLMTKYGKIDVMWYDGWWPFDGEGWQGEKLNAIVRELQPGILVNGRCAVPGDFDTPEGHVTPGADGAAWEACMTLNDHWGFHEDDEEWKSPREVAEMLRQCAAAEGNLLLNVGPRGDGSIPEGSVEILDRVGAWMKANDEALHGTMRFVKDAFTGEGAHSDWNSGGGFTARENAFYWHVRHWPGSPAVLAGVHCNVTEVARVDTGEAYAFRQEGDRVIIDGAPDKADTSMPVVLRFRTSDEPRLYLCGGYRAPNVPHTRYDPVQSDMHIAP